MASQRRCDRHHHPFKSHVPISFGSSWSASQSSTPSLMQHEYRGNAHFDHVPGAARVITTLLSCATLFILALCLARPFRRFSSWRLFSVPTWLLIIFYIDSALFTVSSLTLTKSYSPDHDGSLCDGIQLLCLCLYSVGKCFVYLFFVEKVRLVRNAWLDRRHDKLYLFNTCGVTMVFAAIAVLGFVYRSAWISKSGECLLGTHQPILISMTGADTIINIYLLGLFINPIRKLTSYKNGQTPALQAVAKRAFIGGVISTTTTLMNLLAINIINGERYWLCVMLCNIDILLTALTLHWANAIDDRGESQPGRDDHAVQTGQSKGSGTRQTQKSSQTTWHSIVSVAHPDELPDFSEEELGVADGSHTWKIDPSVSVISVRGKMSV